MCIRDSYIIWRIKTDVDQALLYKFPELPELKKVYPHGYHKIDKMGRPIYIERIGMMNLQKVFTLTTEERLMRYYVREYEKQWLYLHPICCQIAKKKIETCFSIIDLTQGGLGLLSPSVMSFVKIASKICQDYYPETLGTMYIVNCSWYLRTGWSIIKPFLDAKTTEKIHIYGDKYKKDLLEHIEAEMLPEFLGGTCHCEPNGCLNQPAGPWQDILNKMPKDVDEKDVALPEAPQKWKAQSLLKLTQQTINQ
eukprot:TRINITY_DN330_c0_g1_i22.p2 TRINITY_DN330_c0_g1~~TRINITY_DN330_c0_g1_i22.p2  ORF type:complete len:252 (+),score=35.20 TRINITY_DN330_c0_g1_i22:69-824(+)